jgi:hypothetical protein
MTHASARMRPSWCRSRLLSAAGLPRRPTTQTMESLSSGSPHVTSQAGLEAQVTSSLLATAATCPQFPPTYPRRRSPLPGHGSWFICRQPARRPSFAGQAQAPARRPRGQNRGCRPAQGSRIRTGDIGAGDMVERRHAHQPNSPPRVLESWISHNEQHAERPPCPVTRSAASLRTCGTCSPSRPVPPASDRRADGRETRRGGLRTCGSPSRGARRQLRYSGPFAFRPSRRFPFYLYAVGATSFPGP